MKTFSFMIHTLILALILCSCAPFLGTKTLTLVMPTMPDFFRQHDWSSTTQWALYYIDHDMGIGERRFPLHESMQIEVSKMQNTVLLACLEIEGLQGSKNPGDDHMFCAFSAGAIHPYDSKRDSLFFRRDTRAEQAQLMLFLHSRGANIQTLNVPKLLQSMEQKLEGAVVQKEKVLQDMANDELSYWSLRAKNTLDIRLETTGDTWYSMSTAVSDIGPDDEELVVAYPARWYFINTRTKRLGYIVATEEGVHHTIRGDN